MLRQSDGCQGVEKIRNDGVMSCSVGGEEDADHDNAKRLPVAQKTTMCYLGGGRMLRTD
jgi:hypothetical protein